MVRRFALTLPVLVLLPAAWAAGQPAPPPGPDLALAAADGARRVDHAAGDPLLLFVSLSNGVARAAASQNRAYAEILGELQASPRFQALPPADRQRLLDRHRAVEVPVFVLGSADRPVSALVRLVVADPQGRELPVQARALADANVPALVRLDEEEMILLAFGIDAGQIARLAAGTYAVRARLDTRRETAMWLGDVSSLPIEMTIQAPPADAPPDRRLRRLDAAGSYYLASRQFDRVEQTARQMIEIDRSAVSSWVLLGDGLDGLTRRQGALEAFQQALRLYAERPPAGVPEPPDYIERRIREIQAALKRR